MKFANKVKTKPHLAVNKQTTVKERSLGTKLPRKLFKETPFTVAINVTDGLFWNTVVLMEMKN